MRAHTKETQATMTPQKALSFLQEGNTRFQNNLRANRNLLQQVEDTSEGQFPFATILSCIDSRTPAELIFDQGLGDVFSIRIAGNVLSEDVLGSMEFGAKLAGSKLILVLGHTSCGAVKGACDHVRLGNLSGLIQKIEPAVSATESTPDNALRTSQNIEFVDAVATTNVQLTLHNIRELSPTLAEMERKNEIMIVGCMYSVSTGEVQFFDEKNRAENPQLAGANA